MRYAPWRETLASGDWLDARRVVRWSGAFLVVQLAFALVVAAGSHGWIVRLHGSGTTDFVSFYAAGKIAAGMNPAAVYQQAVHYAAERAATDPHIPYVYFFYPPVFLIVCRALAALPYLVAFYLFAGVTLAFYAGVMAMILGPGRAGWWWVPVLGFSPVLWNVGFGQNACLTAGLFGLGCVLVQRGQGLRGGGLLGLLIYKPHTGLLLPLALIAGRERRAFWGASLAVGVCVALSIGLFGWAPWPAFWARLIRSGHEFARGSVTPFSSLVNTAGALRALGVAPFGAVMGQAAVQAMMAVCVAAVWWRCRGAARIAVLVAAAIIAMPVVLFYDLVLPTIAAAVIVARAQESGFLRYEKTLLAVAWLMGDLACPLARAWHLPVGLAACLVILALSLRRAGREAFGISLPFCTHDGTASDTATRAGSGWPKKCAAQLNVCD